ncbi:MAG: hypothetical protein WCG93_13180 [Paludibacter sp.]
MKTVITVKDFEEIEEKTIGGYIISERCFIVEKDIIGIPDVQKPSIKFPKPDPKQTRIVEQKFGVMPNRDTPISKATKLIRKGIVVCTQIRNAEVSKYGEDFKIMFVAYLQEYKKSKDKVIAMEIERITNLQKYLEICYGDAAMYNIETTPKAYIWCSKYLQFLEKESMQQVESKDPFKYDPNMILRVFDYCNKSVFDVEYHIFLNCIATGNFAKIIPMKGGITKRDLLIGQLRKFGDMTDEWYTSVTKSVDIDKDRCTSRPISMDWQNGLTTIIKQKEDRVDDLLEHKNKHITAK